MNQNDFSHAVASIFRRAAIVLSGLILSLVLFVTRTPEKTNLAVAQ
jgi:hypothetical protein